MQPLIQKYLGVSAFDLSELQGKDLMNGLSIAQNGLFEKKRGNDMSTEKKQALEEQIKELEDDIAYYERKLEKLCDLRNKAYLNRYGSFDLRDYISCAEDEDPENALDEEIGEAKKGIKEAESKIKELRKTLEEKEFEFYQAYSNLIKTFKTDLELFVYLANELDTMNRESEHWELFHDLVHYTKNNCMAKLLRDNGYVFHNNKIMKREEAEKQEQGTTDELPF